MREHFSCFPFFLDNTWDIPTALRLTIDLVTFSLIPREFETGERSFASGGSRPSDRRGRGGRGSHPDPEIKGGGGGPGCKYNYLSSLLATRVATRLSWRGARLDGSTRRLKDLVAYCLGSDLSVIFGI